MSIFENTAVKNGALIAGGAALGAGATYLWMKSKKDAAEQAAMAAINELKEERQNKKRPKGSDIDPN